MFWVDFDSDRYLINYIWLYTDYVAAIFRQSYSMYIGTLCIYTHYPTYRPGPTLPNTAPNIVQYTAMLCIHRKGHKHAEGNCELPPLTAHLTLPCIHLVAIHTHIATQECPKCRKPRCMGGSAVDPNAVACYSQSC